MYAKFTVSSTSFKKCHNSLFFIVQSREDWGKEPVFGLSTVYYVLYVPEELIVEPLVAQLLLDQNQPVQGVLGRPWVII